LTTALVITYCLTRIDVKLYNCIKGPFHFNESQARELIAERSLDGSSWLASPFRKEIVQAELKPGSIESSKIAKKIVFHANYREINATNLHLQVHEASGGLRLSTEHDFNVELLSKNAARCLVHNLAKKFPRIERDLSNTKVVKETLDTIRCQCPI